MYHFGHFDLVHGPHLLGKSLVLCVLLQSLAAKGCKKIEFPVKDINLRRPREHGLKLELW